MFKMREFDPILCLGIIIQIVDPFSTVDSAANKNLSDKFKLRIGQDLVLINLE